MPPFNKETLKELIEREKERQGWDVKFVRCGNTIGIPGPFSINHSHIADELHFDSIDDAGYLQYGEFVLNRHDIYVWGRSDYLDIGGEDTPCRKITIELVKEILTGTKTGLHQPNKPR